jgi:regulator of RNase E activity RraA
VFILFNNNREEWQTMDEKTKKIVDGLKEIPYEFLTRVVYEATPWSERNAYNRKLMDLSIKPIDLEMSMVGPAYTINDAKMCANLIKGIEEGCVLVINASDSEGAYVGGLMSKMMLSSKVAGIVIDGYVTHLAKILKMGLPIFCKGSTIRYSGYSFEGKVQVPIQCGGVLVNPNDIIIGNADGVIVLTQEEAEETLKGAKKIMEISKIFLEEFMNKGVNYFDIPDVEEFWAAKSGETIDEWVLYDKWLKAHGYSK